MTTQAAPAINRNRAVNQRLHPDRAWIRALQFIVGGLTLAAVFWNFYQSAIGQNENSLIQSLSMFTNQANLGYGILLIVSAVASRNRLPNWWDHLRGAFAFYMVMTGLIYALLVAEPGEMLRWDVGWTNLVLHRLTPVTGLLGWLLITMTVRGSWGRPLAWLIFPAAFLLYTWLRGASVEWYPYGFLDPTGPGGWGTVLQMTSLVLVAFLAIAIVMHIFGNLRAWFARRSKK